MCLVNWFHFAYYAASLVGIWFVWMYFRRTYWTSWYDVSNTGFLGKLRWDPDVKYLMTADPLMHKRTFRSRPVARGLRDLGTLPLVVSLWWIGHRAIDALGRGRTTEDQMRVPLFLFGFCTLAATLAGVFYQLRLKARSENRQRWINDIREVLGPLIADLPLPDDSDEVGAEKRRQYFPRHARLELLLNPSEEVHRTMMALLRHAYGFERAPIDDIPRLNLGLAASRPETLDELKSQIIRLANVTLKREWEQVKHAR